MNEVFVLYIFVAMLVISIAVSMRTVTAKGKLLWGAVSAFFALTSIIASSVTVFPALGNLLAAIAKLGPHQEGAMALMASGFIILLLIMMAMLYSVSSTEEEVRLLINKVPNLVKWLPPHRDKLTPV